MDFLLRRTFTNGRLLNVLDRRSVREVRGALTVKQEHDSYSHRTSLVARLQVEPGHGAVPMLYDVTLVLCHGDHLVLSGHERIEAGPTREMHLLVQSWHLTPIAMAELERVDNAWAQAARELHELRERIKAAGIVLPDMPADAAR